MSNPFEMKGKQEMDQSLKGESVTRVVLTSLRKAASSVWDGWNDRREPSPQHLSLVPGDAWSSDYPLKAFQEVCGWRVQVYGLEGWCSPVSAPSPIAL